MTSIDKILKHNIFFTSEEGRSSFFGNSDVLCTVYTSNTIYNAESLKL